MTEPTAETPAPETGEETQSTYTPPATQADLDRIISERVARTKAQFKDYQQLKSAADELAQIKTANQTEAQRQAEELTNWQNQAEQWRKAAVGSRIEALASGVFADPSDAVTALAENNYLDAGGQIDTDAIQRDLADVLERKPHWRKPEQGPSGPRVPAPNLNQGNSAGGAQNDPAAVFGAIVRNQLGRG